MGVAYGHVTLLQFQWNHHISVMAQDKIFKFDLLSEINGPTPKVGVAYDQVTTNELSEKQPYIRNGWR